MLVACLFFALLTIIVKQQQVANLTYEILSEGESINITLQEYFENASSAIIVPEKSTANETNFDITIKNQGSQTFRLVSTQEMFFTYKGNKITLDNYKITKTISNQPLKLFLLSNNFLMMYVYKQHAGGQSNLESVIGINLTQNLGSKYNGKNVVCTGMQTQVTYKQLVYVICRVDQQDQKRNLIYSFILLQVTLLPNSQGFIDNMELSRNMKVLQNKSTTCSEYSLKFFQKIKIDNCGNTDIFAYCKNSKLITSPFVYCFTNFTSGIRIANRSKQIINSFQKCTTNAAYISLTQSGFLSVINKQIYEYYYDVSGRTLCKNTNKTNIQPQFATSRFYNNIQISYFFLFKNDNSIYIKSSYRTNYQSFIVKQIGYKITSYALTQLYMMLTISNRAGQNIILIYEMKDLYPRLISRQLIQNSTYGNILLLSTANYLQSGFYVFFYNLTSNQLSLKQYLGYTISIKPKSNIFPINQFQQLPNNVNSIMQSKNNLQWITNAKVFTLYIRQNSTKKHLLVYITVLKYDETGLSPNISNTKMVEIDSTYVYFNLSSLALGPNQRFYIDNRDNDKNIQMLFINYENKIDIASIMQPVNNYQNFNKGVVSQTIKQIALNLQLKVLNPVFTLYYNSFIKNCYLRYIRTDQSFQIDCKNEDKISFKSKIQSNSTKIIVLSKDKWLQYNSQFLQLCSIVGQSGQCQLLPLDKVPINTQIRRIKLNRFTTSLAGKIQMEMFIICDQYLYYGTFYKQNNVFMYNTTFVVTPNQVSQLGLYKLSNINYDKYYNHFLLLHLTRTDQNNVTTRSALIYDRPAKNNNGKFLGHLIKKFDTQKSKDKIQTIMVIDFLIIIMYRSPDGSAFLQQYRITQFYSVYETRRYPLYGRSIVKNGSHTSDGQFLYIQAQMQRKQEGSTQYLLFCPSLSTPNLLTHILHKQSPISFIQQIGNIKNKYPHSIGVNGHKIFALSIPNLVIRFDYDTKDQQIDKITGDLDIKIIDYKNTLYQFQYKYQFNIGAQLIKYQMDQNIIIQVNKSQPKSNYTLQIHNITGPVMQVDFNVQKQCGFIQKNVQFIDIFTKTQCLLYEDSKMYGTLLDMISINDIQGDQVQLIITTQKFLCVQSKKVEKIEMLPLSKSCSIVNFANNIGLFVCDQDQNSVINIINFNNTCQDTQIQNMPKPSWLPYQQYFKMKFSNPFVVFEVPIRVQTNKVYFVTKIDKAGDNYTFLNQSFGLTYQKVDNFNTKDFQIDYCYAYLLEDGLGIYDLQARTNQTTIQPVLWIQNVDLQQALNTTAQFVYIQPHQQYQHQLKQAYKCPSQQDRQIHLQIGTKTDAYDIKICFNILPDKIQTKCEIIIKVTYKQYKDCKNNELSTSKHYEGIKIKLCVLQLQQNQIFANYMPITSKSQQYYMQFYSNPQSQKNQIVYPFRMEKISTNDTFQINQIQGQLIVRSLFNFICYYKLSTQIKWIITYKDSNQQVNKQCLANLTLKNQNCVKSYTIKIQNTDPENSKIMAWIFRIFYFVICLISSFKIWMYIKQKKKKYNKMRYNLLSNQFQHMVKVNSRKQIQIGQSSQFQVEDH